MTARPFQIEIPESALDDLRQRLRRTRWPSEIPGSGWTYGTNKAYLQELCAYWADEFDWRAQERALNRHAHFVRDVDGFRLHYVHAKGRGPNPLPLVLTHGWPSTFYDFDKVIEPLADPGAYGGRSGRCLRCRPSFDARLCVLRTPHGARLWAGPHRRTVGPTDD